MTTEPVTAEAGRDFIRDIVQADLDCQQAQPDRDPVSAGAERLPAYRPCQVDRAQFRHRAGVSAAAAICASTTPIRPRKSRNISTPSRPTCAGSATTGASNLFYASDYFERLYDWAEGLIRAGLAYVDDQSQEEIRLARGTLTEPGKNSPFRDRSVRRKPRSVPPHEGRRVSERRARAARQDRHGVRQHQPARSRALSHPARHSSAHRRPNGRSIRATITPTASRTRSRASRIRSARWNSRITGRSTTGCSTSCRCRRSRISTSSRGSI